MLKSSATLALTPVQEGFEAFDYRTGTQFTCTAPIVDLLSRVTQTTERKQVCELARTLFEGEADAVLASLLDVGALLDEGSTDAQDEADFLARWPFGPSTAIFHQSVSDRAIMPIDAQVDHQIEKARDNPSPPLFFRPGPCDRTFNLPDPETSEGLYPHLERRRTCREGRPFRLELDALSDMLFAGLGITDWTTNRAGQHLPLRYVPSGGARNPYDAYVFVAPGNELDAGIYRYSSIDHSLTFQDGDAELPRFSAMLGEQEWADCASAVIVLVANFHRSMWKYEGDDNAYRVILIEAGHIGQNIMLMAASAGLAACPSAALNHELISSAAGLTRYEQAPIYAMALTKPG